MAIAFLAYVDQVPGPDAGPRRHRRAGQPAGAQASGSSRSHQEQGRAAALPAADPIAAAAR